MFLLFFNLFEISKKLGIFETKKRFKKRSIFLGPKISTFCQL